MIEIKKGKEPDSFVRYKRNPNASYQDMDKDVKKELLESLIREQGHLCAYCMRRIPEKRALPYGVSKVSIEHWFAQNPEDGEDIGQGLDYGKMLAVCAGNRGCGNIEDMTCDAKRGNDELKVNPCNPSTLEGIGYRANGQSLSTNAAINEDLNQKLNLNCAAISLPQTRLGVLNEFLKQVKKERPSGDIKLYCSRKLELFTQPKEYKIPYIGIIIDWLEKKLDT